MDIGGFKTLEADISYVLDFLCIARLISNVHPRSQRERPWGWGWSNFLIPSFTRHVRVILSSLVLPWE